jgi:MarR family transcriptional regulator, organic hydroperoxide resistance regulator
MDSAAVSPRTNGSVYQANHAREPERQLGAVLEFMRLLWAINHGLSKTSRKMHSTFGVTGQQRLVIRLVGAFPGVSAGDLARILHIHPSTLTGILQRLGARGLVKRSYHPEDARRLQLELTARGRRLLVPAIGTVESAVKRALSRFSDEEIEPTRQVLTALSESLETPGRPARKTVRRRVS